MALRVYLASKLYMAEAWRELRSQQIDIVITSSWIDSIQSELEGKATPEIFEKGWARNKLDVQKCDVVLVYGAAGDDLRGALVEVGMGIGLDKTIICVGNSRSFGTWIHYEDAYKAKTISEALELAKTLHP